MAMEQVRAQVKAQVPERGKVLVLETELVRAQAWGRAGEMALDPFWGLVPDLALEWVQVLVQLSETDRVTDQELESAEYQCHPLCHHPAFLHHRADCCH